MKYSLVGRRLISAICVLLLLATAGCNAQAAAGLTALPTADTRLVRLRHALWDNNQIAAVRACADRFEAEHPTVRIEIEQIAWEKYADFLELSAAIKAAPDVFSVHPSHYAALLHHDSLLDLQPRLAAEPLAGELVSADLQSSWQRDGAVYGLALDWEAVGLFYNADMLAAAGISAEELAAAGWNPRDGGAWQLLLQRLTRDASGRTAQDPAFDRALTVQFGLLPQADSAGFGRLQWSSFAAGNGWRLTDAPWRLENTLDDQRLAAALQWFADLGLVQGVMPGFDAVVQRSAADLLLERVGATTIDGTWMIDFYRERAGFRLGLAPLPPGPLGRMSMISGNAAAIWSGTPHREEAWQWLRYLASADCATLIGQFGVMLPAQRSGTEAALAGYAARGLDISAFVAALAESGSTQPFPLSERGERIQQLLSPLTADVMRGALSAEPALQQAQAALDAGD